MRKSEETEALIRLLDEWEGASIGLRRSLARAIDARLEALDPGSLSRGVVARLGSLGLADRGVTREMPANAVFVPFVDDDGRALLAAIQAHEGPMRESALEARMTAECQQGAERAIRAAAVMAERTLADGAIDFVTERRAARVEEVSGRSLALGVFVSALALYHGREVRPGTVVSADIANGEPRGVGQLEAKLTAAVGRSDLERFIVAAEDRPHAAVVARELGLEIEVVGVSSLDAAAAAALGGSILNGEPLESKVERARRSYGEGWGRGWGLVEQAVTPLLGAVPEGRPELRVELRTMLAAARRNAGDAAGALDLLDFAALDLEDAGRWIEKRVLAFYFRQRALALLDQGLQPEALRAAERSMEAAEAAGRPGDYAVALGTLTLVNLGSGEPAPALEAADRALALLAEREPRASLRTQAYRVLALASLGRTDEAEAVLHEVLTGAPDDAYRRRAEGWMRAYLAGALLARGEAERAAEVLRAEVIADGLRRDPDLGPLARFYLGEAFALLGRKELAIDTFERVPAEAGAVTPFQERRVALTRLRRAALLAGDGAREAAARCIEEALPPLRSFAHDELEALREELLGGRPGAAMASIALRCVRPWEPLPARCEP